MVKQLSYRDSNEPGWNGDNKAYYSDELIERIKDPNGSELDAITCSVPSPFARFERVKMAFENISKVPELRATPKGQFKHVIATKEDERLVSESLDLAELVYERSLVKNLDLIHWNFDEAKLRMEKAGREAKRFADTIEIYLNQDAQFNNNRINSNKFRDFYLIKYKNCIIGSTSPSTLFAPADIDLSFARTSLHGDRELFSDFTPLYKRSADFQYYLYYLFYGNKELANIAEVFNHYLEKNLIRLRSIDPDSADFIERLKDNNSQEYLDLASRYEDSSNYFDGDTFQPVKIYNIELPMKADDSRVIWTKSDFLLNSVTSDSQPVLILPPVRPLGDYQDLKYLKDKWSKDIEVDYYNPIGKFNDRILPGTANVKAPYLTVSDLLEPVLIKLPYSYDLENHNPDFFVPSTNKIGKTLKNAYLLPLKPLFFKYFTVQDLIDGNEMKLDDRQKNMSKPRIVFRETEVGTSVELFLPIQNGKQVRIQREYLSNENDFNESLNVGIIHELSFNLAVYPKTRFTKIENFYKVQAIVFSARSKIDFDLNLYKNFSAEPLRCDRAVNRMEQGELLTKHFGINQQFDYIQVVDNTTLPATAGIVIPMFSQVEEGSEEFSFAIDFGTTNTHIEFKRHHERTSKPFEITANDVQLLTLLPEEEELNDKQLEYIDLYDTVLKQLLPKIIGSNSRYRFPHSTVIAHDGLDSNIESMSALIDVNIPFLYNKDVYGQSTIKTELKWRKSGEIKTLTKLYFTELLLLIRHKVLLNKGSLAKTKLVVSYPTSMVHSEFRKLETDWKNLFRQYISSNDDNFVMIPESIAPYYYYSTTEGTAGNSISIDIGGGSTDVVLFMKHDGKDKPSYSTSFRFAANSIFGDGYKSNEASRHPLISRYIDIFTNLFKEKNNTLSNVLNEKLSQKASSADVNAFLFSVENHPDIDKLDYQYGYRLKNDDQFKIVFVYFYTAIIYHIAKWIKHLNQKQPVNFFFSGTGSKILNILDNGPRYKLLIEFTTAILDRVLDNSDQHDDAIKIKFDSNLAKEVTSKGGIILLANSTDSLDDSDFKKKNTVYVSDQLEQTPSYTELKNSTELKSQILSDVREFNTFFLNLLKDDEDYYLEAFGIENKVVDAFKKTANRYLADFLDKGIKIFNNEETEKDKKINNSPFFYPLINSIHELMGELQNIND